MTYDKALIAGKLRRWEKYLERFRLPEWEDIPDIGLYMEQVTVLLRQYLDYMPPEMKGEEQIITPSAINNYVRTKIMPGPENKRYYRVHIAYLLMICTLKQCLSISMIKNIIPVGKTEEEVRQTYEAYVKRHTISAQRFAEEVKVAAAKILDHEDITEYAVDRIDDLIYYSAIIGGWSRLFAEKLILLDGLTLENGGSIEIQ